MQAPELYHEVGFKFLEQARVELAAGELPEASEAGWAAAVQMVKAIAAQRGWPCSTRGHWFSVIDNLVRETGDRDIRVGFSVASTLHLNYFENIRSAQSVTSGLGSVEKLLDKLRPILERGGEA